MPHDSSGPGSPFYRVSLKAIIFDDHARLLVVQAHDDTWELPGGGWEHTESIEQCIQRELTEELQAEVERVHSGAICYYDAVSPHKYQSLKIAIRVEIKPKTLVPSDGMLATKFVSRDELLELKMVSDERGIKDYTDQIWQTVES